MSEVVCLFEWLARYVVGDSGDASSNAFNTLFSEIVILYPDFSSFSQGSHLPRLRY